MGLIDNLSSIDMSKVYFVDEVKSIECSKYALSYDCRLASRKLREIRMNTYNPIYLSNDAGHVLKVREPVDFVDLEQMGKNVFYPVEKESNLKWTPHFHKISSMYSEHLVLGLL